MYIIPFSGNPLVRVANRAALWARLATVAPARQTSPVERRWLEPNEETGWGKRALAGACYL